MVETLRPVEGFKVGGTLTPFLQASALRRRIRNKLKAVDVPTTHYTLHTTHFRIKIVLWGVECGVWSVTLNPTP